MAVPEKVDERLLDFCTNEGQRAKVEAVMKTGSVRAAARLLGVNFTSVYDTVNIVKARAAKGGHAPGHFDAGVAPGFGMGKVTVHRTAAGDVIQTWERQSPEMTALELARLAIEDFLKGVASVPVPDGPKLADADVIPWIQVGDGHLNMLAHEAATGERFNLEIAERDLCAAIGMLIEEMPPVHRAVLHDVGDMTHHENTAGVTAHSGNKLDVDQAYPVMVRAHSRVMRFMIDKILTKAQFVDVIVSQGNHSRVNDFWMAELLRVAYGHTDRVNVVNNDSVFIAYRMGKTFVMCHHSDKVRPADLVKVMATDFPEDWGETEYRYVDIGHIHHKLTSKEHPGAVVESWNQLAASDQYAHEGGWRSKRSITVVYRSRTYGEVGRDVLPIKKVHDMIMASAKACETPYVPPVRRAYAV